MSASWRSDLVRRLAVVALLACALATGSEAANPTRRDSGRVVKKITVGPAGIEIDHASAGAASSDSAGGADSDTGHIRIRSGSDGDVDVQVFGHRGALLIDEDGTGMVRILADAVIPAGDHVDGDVVVLLGSIKVAGQVSGNVVAVGGGVDLMPGSSVDGDAVALGGGVRQAQGATVSGESVSIGFFPLGVGYPALPTMLLTVVACWLLSLFLAWIFGMLFRDRLVRIAATSSRRTAASFFLGLASGPLVAIAVFLLFVTVVGIPIAVLLPVLFVLMVWGGQLAATYVLGCKLIRRPLGQGGTFAPIALGALFVAAFFIAAAIVSQPPGLPRTVALFLAALGGLMAFGLSTIGAGAVLLSRFGSFPADVFPSDAQAPVPAPYPVPAPPLSGGPSPS